METVLTQVERLCDQGSLDVETMREVAEQVRGDRGVRLGQKPTAGR